MCKSTDLCNQVEMVTTDANPDVIPTGKISTFTAIVTCMVILHLSFLLNIF